MKWRLRPHPVRPLCKPQGPRCANGPDEQPAHRERPASGGRCSRARRGPALRHAGSLRPVPCVLSFPPLQVQAGPVRARVTRPGGRPATAPLDARLASPRHGERVFYRRAPDGTSGVPINPLIFHNPELGPCRGRERTFEGLLSLSTSRMSFFTF